VSLRIGPPLGAALFFRGQPVVRDPPTFRDFPRKAQGACAGRLFRGLDPCNLAVLIILLGQVTGAGIA